VTDYYRHNTTNEQWESAQHLLAEPIKQVSWPTEIGMPLSISIRGQQWVIDADGGITKMT